MVTRTNPQNRRCNDCGNMFEPRLPNHRRCEDCHSQQQRSSGQAGGDQNAPQQSNEYRYPEKFPDSYFQADPQGRDCLLTDFVAKSKVDELARQLSLSRNRETALTTGQLRRFFNHCRDVERRLSIEGESWPQVAAGFAMLSAHAQNAAASRPSKIPRLFQEFIDCNVKRVTSSIDPRYAFLEGFLPHFEALVGFGTAHMKDS